MSDYHLCRVVAILILVFVLSCIMNHSSVVYGSTCGCHFIRGDANNDGVVNIADAIYINGYLFSGYQVCNLDSADSNDDGVVDVADSVYLADWLFANGPPPPHPFPSPGCDCSPDTLENCCSPGGSGSLQVTDAQVSPPATCMGLSPWSYSVSGRHGQDPSKISMLSSNDASCSRPSTCSKTVVTWIVSDTSPGVNGDAFGTLQSGHCLAIQVNLTLQAWFSLGAVCDGPPECCNSLKLYGVYEETPSTANQYFRFTKSGVVIFEPIDEGDYDHAYICYRRVGDPPYNGLYVVTRKTSGWARGKLTDVSFTGECWSLTAIRMYFIHWFDRQGADKLAMQEQIFNYDDFSVRLDSIEKNWCP